MKVGSFVGQNNLELTQSEKDDFIQVLEKVCDEIDLQNHEIRYVAKDNYFNLNLPQKLSYKRGLDSINGLKNIKYYLNNREGFETYEQGQEKDWNPDEYNFTEYDLKIRTDGIYHQYRQHHKYDYQFNGKHSFCFDTSIWGFYDEIKENLIDLLNL